MKKLLTVCLLVMTTQAFAQTENVESISKGAKFIGGTVSFYFDESTNEIPTVGDSKQKNTSFGVGPVAGKYLRDNLAVGLYLSYGLGSTENFYYDGTDTESKYQSLSVGSFIRKNYKIVPNLFLFVQGDVWGSGTFNKNTGTSGTEFKSTSWSAGLRGSPGLQFFLGRKLSLETTLGSVGYRFTFSKSPDSDVRHTAHNVSVNGGLGSVTFSVRYFIFP